VINGGADANAALGVAEYVWVTPSGDTRSQLQVVPVFAGDDGPVPEVKPWKVQDLVLVPCFYLPDPFQPQPAFLVLCETRTPNGNVHPWSHRHRLRDVVHREGGRRLADWVMEQQIVNNGVVSWKCAQDFFLRCIDAGIMIREACLDQNAHQWRFTIGRREGGVDPSLGQNFTLEICDHLVLARHLLKKAAWERGSSLGLARPNTVLFSTIEMREDPTVAAHAAEVLGTTLNDEGYAVLTDRIALYDPYAAATELLGALLKEPE
jgi:hypothetical protein